MVPLVTDVRLLADPECPGNPLRTVPPCTTTQPILFNIAGTAYGIAPVDGSRAGIEPGTYTS